MTPDKDESTRLADAQASAVPLHDELHWMGQLYGFPIMCRGAARIEALEAQLADAISDYNRCVDDVHAARDRIDALEAENQRLRGIVPEVLEKLNDELCKENEALKEALEQARVALEFASTVIGRPDDALSTGIVSGALRAIEDARR